jgi:hypothetical protein
MTSARLVIVRRGHFATFELLARTFAGDPSVQIMWDRRVRERRQCARDSGGAERRRTDRRRLPPSQWTQLNYMVAADRPPA